MALFKSKKNTDSIKKEEKKDSKVNLVTKNVSNEDLSWVLKKPHMTEKSTYLADVDRVYVFNVDKKANKILVKKAVTEIYKVIPKKIRVTNMPSKKVFIRGQWGVKSGTKKAYIYLDKKDKIEFV